MRKIIHFLGKFIGLTYVKVINISNNNLPEYKTPGSAGMDVQADFSRSENTVITLGPLGRAIIPTGLFIELPSRTECQVRPRSGLAAAEGITVINAPGTVDSDYRGEIGVILINLSPETIQIKDGERIGQFVFAKHKRIRWALVNKLSKTERGNGAYGHTGRK